ncbi:MAG: glycosyltransferase family 1 protein [Candidatus Electrothrix sp. AUS1_2]|nr:glycosyltransferase family 1 protein [Candidatus Electrothrix sp. AUS1_2]
MNIGIEITKAHHKDGGFGVYPRKLIKNLLNIDNENNYIIFTSKLIDELNEFTNCRQILVPSSDGIINFLKLYFSFRKITKKYDIDILHLLSLYGIHGSSYLTISTVFDLRHLVVSELNERKFGKIIYKYWLPYLLKNSCHFLAISEETKKTMSKYLGISNDEITVTCLGHEIDLSKTSEIKEIDTPERYFLWVGMITKRKNLEVLYKAFAKFTNQYKEYKLIIAGKFSNSEVENNHKKMIEDLCIKNNIVFTGYISDDELYTLYKKSVAFVFPSIYEGFGIPIIEAMALGTPVITTSDGGATKEVAGEAALFFKKYDDDELAEKMNIIASDEKIREQLIKSGKQRAENFTWKKTAELTLDVYYKVQATQYI